MSATTTAKKGGPKAKRVPAARWRIWDALDTEMVFSVVPTGDERLTVLPGHQPGARAVFLALADSEVGDLEGYGLRAVRAADPFADYPAGCVVVDEYEGGQAMYVAAAVGGMLRGYEVLGAEWPDADTLARSLGYPEWLCSVALAEYRAQRGW